MEKKKDKFEDEELIKRNLERGDKLQRVESDEALLHKSDTASLSKHNKQYTALLRAYVKDFKHNSANKRKNKQILFRIAKNLLIWIPIVSGSFMFFTLACLAFGVIDVVEALPGLFTALVSLLGTFMAVPQMITQYLFNEKEEEHLAEIIGKIQEYDRDIRGDL